MPSLKPGTKIKTVAVLRPHTLLEYNSIKHTMYHYTNQYNANLMRMHPIESIVRIRDIDARNPGSHLTF